MFYTKIEHIIFVYFNNIGMLCIIVMYLFTIVIKYIIAIIAKTKIWSC